MSIVGNHTAAVVFWTLLLYGGYGAFQYIVNIIDDMGVAYEVERPYRTRSELSSIPLVGILYQFSCDISDWLEVTARMLRTWAVYIPLVAVAPAAAVATRTCFSLVSTSAAVVKYAQ